MKPTFKASFPKITESELQQFEQMIQTEVAKEGRCKEPVYLPEDYKRFLLETNGGIASLEYFQGRYGSDFTLGGFFLGYYPTEKRTTHNLKFEWDMYIFEEPYEHDITLPIISRSDGSYIAMLLTGVDKGRIFGSYDGYPEKIAESFDEFIQGGDYGEKPYDFYALLEQAKDTNEPKYLLAYLESQDFSQDDLKEMLSATLDKGCFPAVQKLHQMGTPIPDSWTLGTAESVEIAEYMLSCGFRVNEADELGFTPLNRAACIGNLEVVKFLIQKGADYRYINPQNGRSAIQEAENSLSSSNESWPYNYSEEKMALKGIIDYLKSLP